MSTRRNIFVRGRVFFEILQMVFEQEGRLTSTTNVAVLKAWSVE